MLSILLLILFLFGLTFCLLGKKYNQADWGHWFTNIIDGWIRIYCRKFHRQSLQQLDIFADGKLLIACNHISGVDPLLLISATQRPIRFMIAKEEYDKPILNWLYRAAKCIPVDRSGRVDMAFRATLRAMQAGELVGMFPQGGIHSELTPRENIKTGIIKLSQLAKCDILPVRINGVGAAGSVFKSLLVRSHVQCQAHQIIPWQQTQQVDFAKKLTQWLLYQIDIITDDAM